MTRKFRKSNERHIRMRPYVRKVRDAQRKGTNGMLVVESTPVYVWRSDAQA